MKSSALLLLGYSRPELIERRIKELIPLHRKELELYVSLDAYEGPNVLGVKRSFDDLMKRYNDLNWFSTNRKFGLTIHLCTRISELLQEYQQVIVIEDDIATSAQGIKELLNTESFCISNEFFTKGLFGALPRSATEIIFRNRWRTTGYFSAWGWSITRDIWSLYDHQIVKRLGLKAIANRTHWLNLSPHQKRRWAHRFSRVEVNPLFTWDYQMQFLSWLHELDHLLPLWRLCDNEGFEDERATNTRAPRPNWYLGKKSSSATSSNLMRKKSFPAQIMQLVDSYTWIGDRKPLDLIMHK